MLNDKVINYVFIVINFIILFFCLAILIFNPNFIAVIHYSTDMLPVISYTTYSSLQLNIIYIFIILISLNVIFSIYNKFNRLNKLLIKLNPIFAFILIVMIFLNPHLIIISPIGYPTRLDYLRIGGFLLIFLLIIFIIINIIYIIQQKNIKQYLIILTIFIGTAFLSEFIHEGGHAFFVLISGGQITEFRPYPSFLNNEINAGYVGFTGVPLSLIPLVLIGSEIFQWIVVLLVSFLLYYRKWNNLSTIFLKFLLIIAWLDFPLYTINNMVALPHWFIIGSTHGDIVEFSALTGFSIWFMLAIAIIQLITGLIVFFYLGFYKVPFLKNHQKEIK